MGKFSPYRIKSQNIFHLTTSPMENQSRDGCFWETVKAGASAPPVPRTRDFIPGPGYRMFLTLISKQCADEAIRSFLLPRVNENEKTP